MPSTSKKQHNFMAAIAHNPAFAKKVGIPQSVGKDFDEADKGKKFGSGGKTRADVQSVNKPKTNHGKMALFKEGGNTMASKMNPGFMAMMAKKKGAQEGSKADMASDKKQMMGMKNGGMKKMAAGGSASKRADGIASKGKTKGTMVRMNMGGKAC
jgi:hypothetical protein